MFKTKTMTLSMNAHSALTLWLYLIFTLLVVGCDDEVSQNAESLMPIQRDMTITAGTTSPPLAGESSLIGGGTMAGVMGGAEGGMGGGVSNGGSDQCADCAACPPLICDCPNVGSTSFDGCVDGCCEMQSDALCASLCEEMIPPPECAPGETRCIDGVPNGIQRCSGSGMWTLESCGSEFECALGQCLPADCIEGVTRCLDVTQTVICQGGQWVMGEVCEAVCANDECLSQNCGQAAIQRSYLGCEYLAIELPNTINIGQPEHTPTGVVLTNTSDDQDAFITIYDGQGQATDLISERLLPLPSRVFGNPLFIAQTIRSEIKDASGMVVESGVMRADQVRIPPQGIGTFLLPETEWPLTGSIVSESAFRVVSTEPVGAYQFSPLCCNYSFSNDASLLIPTTALGQSYRFLGAPHLFATTSTGDEASIPANLTVVAAEDQTVVRVTLPPNGFMQAETTGRMTFDNGAHVVTLNRQEVLMLRTDLRRPQNFLDVPRQADFTGASIESSAPVSLFSAHECTFYPSDLGACDHLEEQLFPIETWGRAFTLVPPKLRSTNSVFERTYWKILGDPNTRVTLSATFNSLQAAGPGSAEVPDCGQMLDSDGQTIVIGAEGFCEFSTQQAVEINSDLGIMVMGIISGQQSVNFVSDLGDHYGDPAIFLVPPSRQLRQEYSFLTPGTYYADFVALSFNPNTQITLDGAMLDLSDASTINGSEALYKYVELSDGPHKISGTAPFGIMVFAYDDFVSYAFTGGLNLTKQ
jgi:hypothetical protein